MSEPSEGTGSLAVPEGGTIRRLDDRDLPWFDARELGRDIGLVRLVAWLAPVFATLGALAVLAGIALGMPLLAAGATAATAAILYALWEDTRFSESVRHM